MTIGIKTKQVVGVTAIVGVTIVALGLVHLSSLARVLLTESRARGELLTNAIYHRARVVVSDSASPYEALGEDSGLRSILESSIYSKNVTYAAIVDSRGSVVAHSDPGLMPAELPPAAHFDDLLALGRLGLLAAVYSDRGRTLEVEQPLLLEEQSFGSIRVGVSTILIGGELDAALGEALVTMAVALVVSVIVAMLLAQWLLSPIHVIRSGLTRLGRGEFGATLDLKQRDELGELGEYFNDISAQFSVDRDGAGTQNREQVLRVLDYSRKLTALSRLSTGLAHEVKNPLNAMTIHLELLRQKLAARASDAARPSSSLLQDDAAAGDADSPVDVSEALRHAAVIGDEIARLDHVLQGFLKFSRPEEIQPEPVAVKALMDEVAGLVEAEARHAGVRVVVEGAPAVPRISADSDMIRQALLNLARNACQAMPEGGVLRLACAAASGDRVEITVTDTGVGIEPEDLDRIFNLYFTTKAEGSGIGLSLVYRIVQMHDGEVEVESAPGHGTTFRVWLPTAVADEA